MFLISRNIGFWLLKSKSLLTPNESMMSFSSYLLIKWFIISKKSISGFWLSQPCIREEMSSMMITVLKLSSRSSSTFWEIVSSNSFKWFWPSFDTFTNFFGSYKLYVFGTFVETGRFWNELMLKGWEKQSTYIICSFSIDVFILIPLNFFITA